VLVVAAASRASGMEHDLDPMRTAGPGASEHGAQRKPAFDTLHSFAHTGLTTSGNANNSIRLYNLPSAKLHLHGAGFALQELTLDSGGS
jgi:hypothetical protein